MKIIIPYRENSERCFRKNTKEFVNGRSLLKISVEQARGHDIYLACVPSDSAIDRAEKLGVRRIDLPDYTLTGSSSDLVTAIAEQTEGLIGFLYCTNPVFYKYNCLESFLTKAKDAISAGAGSAIVVYPFKHYVLDENMQGLNHGQGTWHKYSQFLPQWYIHPWVLMVTSTSDVLKYKYWYTPDVVPLEASGPCVDIDTDDDFNLAKFFYNDTQVT